MKKLTSLCWLLLGIVLKEIVDILDISGQDYEILMTIFQRVGDIVISEYMFYPRLSLMGGSF